MSLGPFNRGAPISSGSSLRKVLSSARTGSRARAITLITAGRDSSPSAGAGFPRSCFSHAVNIFSPWKRCHGAVTKSEGSCVSTVFDSAAEANGTPKRRTVSIICCRRCLQPDGDMGKVVERLSIKLWLWYVNVGASSRAELLTRFISSSSRPLGLGPRRAARVRRHYYSPTYSNPMIRTLGRRSLRRLSLLLVHKPLLHQ